MGWLGKLFGGASGDGRRSEPHGGDASASWAPPVQLAERSPRMLMLHEGHLYPVVGEASYQRTLARLAGRLGPDGPTDESRWHIADLVPEPNNPHDPNAIGVLIGGEHVGYIARDRTELYHSFLHWARAGTNKIGAHLKLPTGQALEAWAHEQRPIRLQPAQAPADWYPDPHGQHRLRYFDGTTWTDHVAD